MNKRNIIFILLFTLAALTSAAQTNKDSLYILGVVADGFTKAAVPDALVTLMRQDSTVVDTISVQDSHTWVSGVGRGNATSRYYFRVSREPQDYIIKVEHPNYETAFASYTQKRVSRRLQYTDVPTAYRSMLDGLIRQLPGVEATTSTPKAAPKPGPTPCAATPCSPLSTASARNPRNNSTKKIG